MRNFDRVEPGRRWYFAFWCDLRDGRGRWLPFPSVSLGFFRVERVAAAVDDPWWRGWRLRLNNDD